MTTDAHTPRPTLALGHAHKPADLAALDAESRRQRAHSVELRSPAGRVIWIVHSQSAVIDVLERWGWRRISDGQGEAPHRTGTLR